MAAALKDVKQPDFGVFYNAILKLADSDHRDELVNNIDAVKNLFTVLPRLTQNPSEQSIQVAHKSAATYANKGLLHFIHRQPTWCEELRKLLFDNIASAKEILEQGPEKIIPQANVN